MPFGGSRLKKAGLAQQPGLSPKSALPQAMLFSIAYLGLVTSLGYLSFSGWAYDDPYITYRYAENLRHGLGFVYNPGERVLSTTTPLFTLLLTLLGYLWSDLPHLANLIGAFCLGLGGLALWDMAHSLGKPWAGWAGLLLYPTFPLLLTTLGSETLLYLALCLGAFAFYLRRRYLTTALCSVLAVLTRPDGALVALIWMGDYLVRALRQRPWSSLRLARIELGALLPWRSVIVFVLLVLPWFLFAWAYFGSPLPATLAVKQHQGAMAISQRFASGLLTIADYYMARWHYWAEALLAALGLAWMIRRGRNWLLLIGWTILYFLSYSVLGVSRYYWYYAPLVPGFLLVVGLGAWVVGAGMQKSLPRLSRSSPSHQAQWIALIASLLMIAMLAYFQAGDLWRIRQHPDHRYRIYRAVGEWLRANTSSQERVGALEVGIIGYYARNPMVDFAGLIQPAVARQLGNQTTYEDAALWAVEHEQMDYLVLQEGVFPRLEASFVQQNCTPLRIFSGEDYGFSTDLTIYACRRGSSGDVIERGNVKASNRELLPMLWVWLRAMQGRGNPSSRGAIQLPYIAPEDSPKFPEASQGRANRLQLK